MTPPHLRLTGPMGSRKHNLTMNKILAPVALVLATLIRAPAASAESDPAPAESGHVASERVVTRSASGRFLVAGARHASNAPYARWAEETATRLERLLGITLSAAGKAPIEMVVSIDKAAGPAVIATCRREGTLLRTLTVNESHQPDLELMEEGLCSLLLDGVVDDLRRARGLSPRDPAVPVWLSMGIAQNLAAETRNRNRKLVVSWSPPADRPEAATVLRWRSLPEGWPRNRALCGMVVYWLGSMREGSGAYTLLLEGLAGDEGVGPEWVADRVAKVASVAMLERAWQEWLGRQGRTVQDLGALSSRLLEQLRSELDLELPAAGDAVAGSPRVRRLTPSDVLAERRWTAYLQLVAGQKVQAIRALTLGKASELVEAGEGYCRFYDSVARGSWRWTARYRLYKANTALTRLTELTRAREAYLDEVERELAAGPGRSAASVREQGEPVLEKSRMEAYVDDAEYRFGQRQTERGAGREPGP